jgi:hypothetical protein
MKVIIFAYAKENHTWPVRWALEQAGYQWLAGVGSHNFRFADHPSGTTCFRMHGRVSIFQWQKLRNRGPLFSELLPICVR